MTSVLKILSKKENKLLERTEVVIEVTHPLSSTPQKKEIREMLSKEMQVPKDNIVVKDCQTRFGTHITRGIAKLYHKNASLQAIEHKYVLKRIAKEKGEKVVHREPRKLRKEQKNKNKKIRGTMATYKKKAEKRQAKMNQ